MYNKTVTTHRETTITLAYEREDIIEGSPTGVRVRLKATRNGGDFQMFINENDLDELIVALVEKKVQMRDGAEC